MRNYRKERGRRTEHAVAARWADGWPHVEVVGAGAPGRDLKGTPGLAVEIKACGDFSPVAFLHQAIKNAGTDLPLVIYRPNGWGERSIDYWPTLFEAGALARLAGGLLRLPVVRRVGFNLHGWLREARLDRGGDLPGPGVVLRLPGVDDTTFDLWPAVILHGRARQLLRANGYGNPAEDAA